MTTANHNHREPRSIAQSNAARSPWSAPRLRELGSVVATTHKVDKIGRNDGGSGKMRRT